MVGRREPVRVMLVAGAAASAMFVLVVITSSLHTRRTALVQQQLYNKWGTSDDNDHWGGVGSENYHTAKWDNTGSNIDYHPRDSSSGDGESMEPAWWRSGPGANSEYTGHAMDGELYSPPDEKIFKPFFMKQLGGARASQLFDVDGPSPRDPPPSSWAAAGRGTTDWMLRNEGPLLASTQEQMPREHRHKPSHRAQTATAKQVERAEEHPHAKPAAQAQAPRKHAGPKLVYSKQEVHLERPGLHLKLISPQQAARAPPAPARPHVTAADKHVIAPNKITAAASSSASSSAGELMSDRQQAMQKSLQAHQAEMQKQLEAHQKQYSSQLQKHLEQQPKKPHSSKGKSAARRPGGSAKATIREARAYYD